MDEPAYKVWESEIKQLREELEGSAISRIEREGVSDRVGLLKLMNQTGVESYDRALEGVIDSFYMTSYAILELAGHPIHQSSLSERIEIADVKRNIETGMNLFEEGNYQQIVDGIEALMKSVRRPETRDNYNPIPLFAMVTLYFRINRVCKKVQGLVKPIPKDIDARSCRETMGILEDVKRAVYSRGTEVPAEIKALKDKYAAVGDETKISALIDGFYFSCMQAMEILNGESYRGPFELTGLRDNMAKQIENKRRMFVEGRFEELVTQDSTPTALLEQADVAEDRYIAPLIAFLLVYQKIEKIGEKMRKLAA